MPTADEITAALGEISQRGFYRVYFERRDQLLAFVAAISRILANAIGACASYSRYLTRRSPVWSRTIPRDSGIAPAPSLPFQVARRG